MVTSHVLNDRIDKKMEKPNHLDESQRLEDIRRDIRQGSCLSPFRARTHIVFLLNIYDELAQGLGEIQQMMKSVQEK